MLYIMVNGLDQELVNWSDKTFTIRQSNGAVLTYEKLHNRYSVHKNGIFSTL